MKERDYVLKKCKEDIFLLVFIRLGIFLKACPPLR